MRIHPSSRHLALLLPILLAACETVHMATPPDLVGAEVLDVSNRTNATGLLVDESFNVGPYQVRKVKRGWDTTTSVSVGPFVQERGHQGFRFHFIGEQDWEGRCDLSTRDRSIESTLDFFLSDSHAQLECSCATAHESVSLKLDDSWRPLQGGMTLGNGVRYNLRQEGFPEGLRARTLGYRVEAADGHAVAAVELKYPGRIWRQPDLPVEQREPQACLLGALMIHGLR